MERGSLSAKILRAKYFKGNQFVFKPSASNSTSSMWRGIYQGSKLLENGIIGKIENRKDAKFQKDVWLRSGTLIQYLPDQQYINEFVQDYFLLTRWNLDKLQSMLPLNIINEICAIYAKKNSTNQDFFYKKHDTNEKFTVKSAYDSIRLASICSNWNWKSIWKANISPKISHFLWTLSMVKS